MEVPLNTYARHELFLLSIIHFSIFHIQKIAVSSAKEDCNMSIKQNCSGVKHLVIMPFPYKCSPAARNWPFRPDLIDLLFLRSFPYGLRGIKIKIKGKTGKTFAWKCKMFRKNYILFLNFFSLQETIPELSLSLQLSFIHNYHRWTNRSYFGDQWRSHHTWS